jgi:hypothetical protein
VSDAHVQNLFTSVDAGETETNRSLGLTAVATAAELLGLVACSYL